MEPIHVLIGIIIVATIIFYFAILGLTVLLNKLIEQTKGGLKGIFIFIGMALITFAVIQKEHANEYLTKIRFWNENANEYDTPIFRGYKYSN